MFAYAGNNPVKYTDPDGRDINIKINGITYGWVGIGQSGWSGGAPQKYAGFGDWMDEAGKLIGFDLDAISIVTDNFTLRLWKGNYAGLVETVRQKAEANDLQILDQILSLVGGSGGEIGLYNNDNKGLMGGSSMDASQMENLGIVSTSIQIINKNSGKIIGSRTETEQSFWTTSFSWFDKSKKEDLYTVNTFKFNDRSKALSFTAMLNAAKQNSIIYGHNRDQNYNVIYNVLDNTVTVTWGKD